MNHTCNGFWIPALNLYRCLKNGEFIKLVEQPNTCRICHRNVAAMVITGSVSLRPSILEEICIDGRWYEISKVEGNERIVNGSDS